MPWLAMPPTMCRVLALSCATSFAYGSGSWPAEEGGARQKNSAAVVRASTAVSASSAASAALVPITSCPIHSITCVMPMLRSSRYSDQPTISLPPSPGTTPLVEIFRKQKSDKDQDQQQQGGGGGEGIDAPRKPAPQRRHSMPVIFILNSKAGRARVVGRPPFLFD